MAIHCPIDFDVEGLRRAVQATYEQVVEAPDGDFHFHRGIEYACDLLRYERAELESLPVVSTERFAGVANPHRIGTIDRGETVLDIGSGSGADLLLAARRVAPEGRAIGIDMTPAMRELARHSAIEAGLGDVVELREGLAEELPVEDGSVDVVISNGVLNLTTDKERAFGEIARVLRPGGRLHLADVVIKTELREDTRDDIDLWAA
jgi:SAM-dependent methyltransferase